MRREKSAALAEHSERVICIDEHNRMIGHADKQQVHKVGVLHRAFSVFLFNSQSGRLLLQRRALTKYHSGGLWANSCCGHPRPGEPTRAAAIRRVHEELGIAVDVTETFRFRYRVELGNGLIENELVHMMFGRCTSKPVPDPREASEVRWIGLYTLASEVSARPECYAPWLRLYLENCLSDLARSANELALYANRGVIG